MNIGAREVNAEIRLGDTSSHPVTAHYRADKVQMAMSREGPTLGQSGCSSYTFTAHSRWDAPEQAGSLKPGFPVRHSADCVAVAPIMSVYLMHE